jgi:tetratricopeptide (TPR) repeat protein
MKTKTPDGLLTLLAAPLLLSPPLAPTARAQPLPSPSAATSTDAGETVSYLRSARNAFIDAQDFQGALGPARDLVERDESSGDPERPRDIATLGRVQAELGDFDAAELNYLQAVGLIQEAEGEFSVSLMDAYQGLGRNYIKSRRFTEAVAALDQARHISQRNLGLFNVTQTSLIDDLTTAYLGLGDTVTAKQLQQERLENALRRFGEDDTQTIPFRYQLASYYEQSRLRSAARAQYEKIVTLIEQQRGADDPLLLRPLRALLRIELLLGDRDEAHARIVDIVGRNPDVDAMERALTLAALGDWSIAKEDAATARGYYAEAYRLLADGTDKSPRETFAKPETIDFIAPLSPVDRGERAKPSGWGSIVLAFEVSADGRASNVSVVEAKPAGVMDASYSRRIRETHFRPRLVDGEPVATAGVRSTHYFRYYVEEAN